MPAPCPHSPLFRWLSRTPAMLPGVVAAMEADEARKLQMIERLVPRAIGPLFQEFAGMCGGQVFEGLKRGTLIYSRFVIRKL